MTAIRPYQIIARVYDTWVAHMDYDRMVEFALAHARGPVTTCLDVCCGTGTLALRLAERGIDAVGVDAVDEMLDVARGKTGAGVSVRWVHQDVVGQPFPDGPFDLVSCTSDSVNYFSPAELERFLSEAHRVLRSGGSLLFDINSDHRLRTFFGNSVYGETHADWAYIWKNSLFEAEGFIVYDITMFLAEGDACYRRYHEQHRQYLYPLQGMLDTLSRHGYRDVLATADYGDDPAAPTTPRISFLAHKGA